LTAQLTNWETYRKLVRDKANLAIKLKEHEDVELATDNFISVLQHAAQEATPARKPQRPTNNIPSEIKRLVAAKRKATSTWQRTHTPDSRRIFNQASNKLKSALHEMRNAFFTTYVSNLKRDDNSTWKPIKNKKKPQTSLPPIRKYSIPPGPWAKSDKEKADLFAEHLSEVFSPHNSDQDQDVERDLAKHTQPPENLQAFTLREIKNEITMLNSRRAPGIDLITAQMLKELPHEGFLNLMYLLKAILTLDYWLTSLKRAQIIMIPKPGKNQPMSHHTDQLAYCP